MSLSINARLQRGYQLSRRLRRFARHEQELRRRWGPSPRPGLDLLADGFHRDKLGLYPGIEDPVIRAAYVSDLTAQRVRMFNGKSGDLLTRKDVLLRVLAHHGQQTLRYHLSPTSDGGARTSRLLDLLGPGTVPVVAVLRSRDAVSPQIVDLEAASQPVMWPGEPAALVVLDAAETVDRTSRASALRDAASTPTVLQVGVYWDATGPFVGHAAALRPDRSRRESWPMLGPGLRVERIDPTSGEALEGTALEADTRGRLHTTRRSVQGLVPPSAAVDQLQRALALSRRFPNLSAIGFNYLLVADELVLIDASNRLDVVFPQLFGPLLEDPQLRSAYLDAGMRPLRQNARAIHRAQLGRPPTR